MYTPPCQPALHHFGRLAYNGLSGKLKQFRMEDVLMCNNGFFGGNNCWCIILVILLLFGCGGCGNTGCGSESNNCGCGCGCN